MAITLSDGTTTITLPADLQWSDEFGWSAVEQDREYSLTGALVVQQGLKAKGRPITLQSGGASWLARSVVQQIKAYYDTPDQIFTLTINGDSYSVQFERPDGFEAAEVVRQANPGPEHWYTIKLRLFEVEE